VASGSSVGVAGNCSHLCISEDTHPSHFKYHLKPHEWPYVIYTSLISRIKNVWEIIYTPRNIELLSNDRYIVTCVLASMHYYLLRACRRTIVLHFIRYSNLLHYALLYTSEKKSANFLDLVYLSFHKSYTYRIKHINVRTILNY